jgi:hypothetical protein
MRTFWAELATLRELARNEFWMLILTVVVCLVAWFANVTSFVEDDSYDVRERTKIEHQYCTYCRD